MNAHNKTSGVDDSVFKGVFDVTSGWIPHQPSVVIDISQVIDVPLQVIDVTQRFSQSVENSLTTNQTSGVDVDSSNKPSSPVKQSTDMIPPLVGNVLTTDVVFYGDEAVKRAAHFREKMLKRVELIYKKMSDATRTLMPVSKDILENWTLENLGDIVPLYTTNKNTVFNETLFLSLYSDTLLEPKWAGLSKKIEELWWSKPTFADYISINYLLTDRPWRDGFPKGVLEDITLLGQLHKKCYPKSYPNSIENQHYDMISGHYKAMKADEKFNK